jgi:hypothetical protein
LLTLGHVLLPLGEPQLGRRNPFAPLVDLDQPRAHLGLHGLELDELAAPRLDASLGVLDQTLANPKTSAAAASACSRSARLVSVWRAR